MRRQRHCRAIMSVPGHGDETCLTIRYRRCPSPTTFRRNSSSISTCSTCRTPRLTSRLRFGLFSSPRPTSSGLRTTAAIGVATRAEDIDVMQREFTLFSNDQYVVPKKPEDMEKELPLEVDPPRHTALRRPLTIALMPSVVKENEERIRELAVSLIEGFEARGSCDFVSEFAQVFPIGIFLDLGQSPA